MDSSKNGRWIIPFKTFNRLRVKPAKSLQKNQMRQDLKENEQGKILRQKRPISLYKYLYK